MRRRVDGRETWKRLLEWEKGQAPSERLAFQILIQDKFESVDPSHPLGGRDGKKDILCRRNGYQYTVGCYFSRGQQSFKIIKDKFLEDATGIERNSVEGIIFVTNQELRLSERKDLEDKIDDKYDVYIYHLERVASLLNNPINYGIRLEFLDIEMTKEEQLAYMASKDQVIHNLTNLVIQGSIQKDDTKTYESSTSSVTVFPEYVNTIDSLLYRKKPFHKCSYCNYGYKIGGGLGVSVAAITGQYSLITCPKCGNTEENLSI